MSPVACVCHRLTYLLAPRRPFVFPVRGCQEWGSTSLLFSLLVAHAPVPPGCAPGSQDRLGASCQPVLVLVPADLPAAARQAHLSPGVLSSLVLPLCGLLCVSLVSLVLSPFPCSCPLPVLPRAGRASLAPSLPGAEPWAGVFVSQTHVLRRVGVMNAPPGAPFAPREADEECGFHREFRAAGVSLMGGVSGKRKRSSRRAGIGGGTRPPPGQLWRRTAVPAPSHRRCRGLRDTG